MLQTDRQSALRQVPRKLTEQDRQQYATRVADLDWLEQEAESQLKEMQREKKTLISGYIHERRKLSNALRTGEETVEVECTVDYDYANNAVRYYSSEGDVIHEREMLNSERQLNMFFEQALSTPKRGAK